MQDSANGAYVLLACLPSQVCLPAGTLAACLEYGHARCIWGNVVSAHTATLHDAQELSHVEAR